MSSVNIENLEDLKNWVAEFSSKINFKDIVLLEGQMGAGKSQLVQFLVESLSDEQSCSPSYAIHNCYETPKGSIDHLDMYRIEDEDDLESTGFWDLFDQDKAVICIEWADRMDPSVYPRGWNKHQIKIEKIDDNKRIIHYSKL